MKNLFLASSFSDVTHIFTDFVSDLRDKRVTFIPTASKVEKVVFYVKLAKKAFEKMGLIVDELEISTVSFDMIESKIKNNDFIYISGGNTFYLLQELKRTGADKIIINEVNAGKIYIGESAGAMVVSKNIIYAKDMNSIKKAPNLDNFDSLDLVDFYPVPHHANEPFKKIVEKIISRCNLELNLMPISNHEAILVSGSEVVIKNNSI